MNRFTIWLSNTWNTLKNVGSQVGSLIGKAASILRTIGNAKSYLLGKVSEIGKAINHYSGMIDSFTGLIPNSPLNNQIMKYTGNVNQVYLQQQNPMKYQV
jgi:hypothetical protein